MMDIYDCNTSNMMDIHHTYMTAIQNSIREYVIHEGHSSNSWQKDSSIDDATQYHAQDIRFYSGNDPNYLNNALCTSSPALDKDDPTTYYQDEEAYNPYIDPFG